MYFLPFSLENKLFGIHQTSFLPAEALEFSELKTPLVYTFFPSNIRCREARPFQQSHVSGPFGNCQELIARHSSSKRYQAKEIDTMGLLETNQCKTMTHNRRVGSKSHHAKETTGKRIGPNLTHNSKVCILGAL